MKFNTINDIQKLNVDKGQHFFDEAAMTFFDSIIESGVINGNLFITSECFEKGLRLFTIRYARDDGTIGTVGEFQRFATLLEAVTAAELMSICTGAA